RGAPGQAGPPASATARGTGRRAVGVGRSPRSGTPRGRPHLPPSPARDGPGRPGPTRGWFDRSETNRCLHPLILSAAPAPDNVVPVDFSPGGVCPPPEDRA